MTISDTIKQSSVDTLRAMVAGEVVAPGDQGYDEARRAWDLAADQQPAVVVFAESIVDIVRAVRFASSQGLRIAPQSTGHGALPLEPLEDALLLRTSRMRRVEIFPAIRNILTESSAFRWPPKRATDRFQRHWHARSLFDYGETRRWRHSAAQAFQVHGSDAQNGWTLKSFRDLRRLVAGGFIPPITALL